jgi:bifunctional ADP-heptose synthase (sugar kinase/adenylyltransferase)
MSKIYPSVSHLQQNFCIAPSRENSVHRGCFDLLHPGHIIRSFCESLGEVLVVGINSDASKSSGEQRPILQRAGNCDPVLAALGCGLCHYVGKIHLSADSCVAVDILVKGGDWSVETVVAKRCGGLGGSGVDPIKQELPPRAL